MKFVLTAVILGLVMERTSAHQLRAGSCKPVVTMPNFDPERFSGGWYVLGKTVTASSCLVVDFERKGDNILTITERRTPFLSQMAPVDLTFGNVGQLDMDPSQQASMTLKWDGNFLGVGRTTVNIVSTDYETFAAEIECQSLWGVLNRVSATIMGREKTLDDETMSDLMDLLESNYIDLSRMSIINHDNCAPIAASDANIMWGENGFSLVDLRDDEKVKNLQTQEEIKDFVQKNAHECGDDQLCL